MRILLLAFFCSLLLASCKNDKPTKETPPAQEEVKPTPPKVETISPMPPKEGTPKPKPAADEFNANYLMGKFSPSKHASFTKIKGEHTSKSNIYMRKDAYASFVKMYEAAKKDGIRLKIVSATRAFAAQRGIWEAKWSGARKVDGQDLSKTIPNAEERALKILEFSSMPGTSRHHWGTDIDLNNLNNSWFEKGDGKRIYEWLTANAAQYGYCQVYSPKGANRPNGYEEEKWHWSYLPVAKTLLQEYQKLMSNTSVKGFKGSEAATGIDVVEKYVVGINPNCK